MENNSKTIIFFIHGFCGSKLNNKILEDNFIKDGYVTVSFDLPGHGDDYENFINKGKKDWIKKVEDEFEKIKDFNNIVIIGFSMGADLALMLYDKIENKIKEKIKLILLSPAFSANKKFFPGLFNVLIGLINNKSFKIKSSNPGCNNPSYKNYYVNKINFIPSKRLLDLYLLIEKGKRLVKKVNTPILIFHSRKDVLSLYSKSKKIFIKVKSKQKAFITLKKSNHFIQLDYENEIVYSMMKKFIENDFNIFILENEVKQYIS